MGGGEGYKIVKMPQLNYLDYPEIAICSLSILVLINYYIKQYILPNFLKTRLLTPKVEETTTKYGKIYSIEYCF